MHGAVGRVGLILLRQVACMHAPQRLCSMSVAEAGLPVTACFCGGSGKLNWHTNGVCSLPTTCTLRARMHAVYCWAPGTPPPLHPPPPHPPPGLQAVYQIAADLAGLAAVADKRFGPASVAAPGSGKSCGGCSGGANSAAAGSLSMAAMYA